MTRFRLAATAAVLAALAGCATVDPFSLPPMADHLARADTLGDCARALQDEQRAVREAGVADVQDTSVPGFPHLRVDRLGAASVPAPGDEAGWHAWRDRLAALAEQARAFERRHAGLAGSADPQGSHCQRLLEAADNAPAGRDALRRAAQVPDDYSTAARALGLYPLTRLAFAAGIRGWHAQTRSIFALPLDALPVEGRLQRLVPAPDAAASLAGVAGTPPAHAAADDLPGLRRLLLRHAPVLEVDHTGEHDRVGPLAWRGEVVAVDTAAAPVAYVRLSHALLGGAWRRQLVYTFWFPRRPKAHALDLLGGELDALVWRVTLDDDGQALVYDSIHACGCYHLFFATERVRPRAGRPPGQGALDEGLFMPQPPLPAAGPGAAPETVVLRIQGRTHYLQRVARAPASLLAGRPATDRQAEAVARAPLAYHFVDEDSLRSLARPGAPGQADRHRSIYDGRGLIPGSERLERFLFWPMGIASAGQMRQWGRHATAFVGRRHFDDPGLLDRYFELRGADPAPH